ncbi:MAG: TonB-dependent receptor [Neisseria sp.]|nr:TonB-dependent receptor [Neisseria sp.]
MGKQSFKLKILVVMIAGISICATAAAEENVPAAEAQQGVELQSVVVEGKRLTADQKGEAAVFSKNVSNVYAGREYLERYRVDSAGDILKGLNGVYNMNTRTAGGAITPNIRGVAGKGRIPLTIDGTEQTVDVWLNNYGVGDRNYVDPALFRSIAVEKSPAMTRGMKSGVGGSIAIRTIEPEDIIPEGKKWGVEVKTEVSNNTVKPKNDLGQYLGWPDYRTLPGGATADGAGGGADPFTGQWSPNALILDGLAPPENKSSSDNYKFSGDKALMLSAAFKTDLTDGLAAYSHRSKGNYFAGKRGAEGYLNNPIYDNDCAYDNSTDATCKSSASFIPNMAKIYKPGSEVFNSHTETKTLLLKNNWYLPSNQKISLQYMKNDIAFGEINPFQTAWELNFDELNQQFPKEPPKQVPGTSSKIKSNTYKIGYEWKPEDNKWIDLQANIWRTRTDSTRHQSGGMSLASNLVDPLYDAWRWCNVRNRLPPSATWANSCDDLRGAYGFTADTTQDEIIQKSWITDPEMKKQFAVISGARQTTHATRTGADISNRFQLRDNLAMTVGADIQHEELDENTQIINSDDLFNMYGTVTGLATMAGPRSGKRREWGANLGFDWQPTDRLSIQAGVRYHRFRVSDTALARERANRNPRYAAGGGAESYVTGIYIPYWQLLGDQEAKDYREVEAANHKWGAAAVGSEERERYWLEYLEKKQVFGEKYNYPKYDEDSNARRVDNIRRAMSNGDLYGNRFSAEDPINIDKSAFYKINAVVIPYRDGKLDSSAMPLTPAMFEEKVNNPQGKDDAFYKYLAWPYKSGSDTYEEVKNRAIQASNFGTFNDDQVSAVTRKITEAEKWQKPQDLRGSAWAPMLSVSYELTDNGRIFARYAEMTRFPSIYEATAATSGGGLIDNAVTPEFNLKPERSRSWEIGYAFNFTPYWQRLRHGDVRLTWFDNSIKNVLDTTADRRIVQYDKKITRGLELQSRIDTGRYFASFGATYRLKQLTCDSDLAFSHDMYMRRVPDCIEGGFGATRFYQALQPKYSLNLDIGTRLLGEKLELGMRGIYHSKVETKQYDDLIGKGMGSIFTTTGKPYHWRPVFLTDVYGRYQLNKNLSMNIGVTNLTNRYYLDPMSNVPTPGPGRTVTLGIKGKF